ncbi:6-phospho-beta-glucosidase [Scopulibacillus darangshiensis]|uniref:6-phospho-beta-glucosidase n=1 Tax=Scopulibacillus darangshiensis TaxID=442528 RepID=A0A4R2P7V1_9BACL|nr:glycoside hydrolase [Scopulibacillus darangshiensis]TCP30972.1 6-phospho-beta-glucosidase [Scopulibacillus darangshiensis]
MARIKLAYIGGGSTRAPGTMASFIHQGENFNGSEVVLIDLTEDRLQLVKELSEKMARNKGIELKITTTTNQREGLRDCDAVLTSFRPGGFEARYIDESIPLKHGIIGQETQGPGGFFMALRSIHVMKSIIKDMEEVCPKAKLFNYTNPINIVSEAVSHHTDIPIVSLCEGPIIFPKMIAKTAGLDPDYLEVEMIGLNHNCWSTHHLYKGQDIVPILKEAYEEKKNDQNVKHEDLRMLKLAVTMNAIPSDYFKYYYFKDEVIEELRAKPMTRSQEIMSRVPNYWKHYREEALSDNPQLDPARSRGGIHELELAFDVMDAVFNDRKEVWMCNVSNRGAIPDFADDLIVEVPCFVDKNGVTPLAQNPLPGHVAGLLKMLGEYQSLTAKAAWNGTRIDAIRALATNPLVSSLNKAEIIYDKMAHALQDYLPDRLLKNTTSNTVS